MLAGRENICVEDIRAYNNDMAVDNISPFIPMRESFFKKQGNIKEENSIMFPGYVFIEASMDSCDFLDYVKKVRRIYGTSMTVLRYGESDEIAVKLEERIH